MTHDHILLCPLNANIRTQRHNEVVKFIQQHINDERLPKVKSAVEGEYGGLKPDLECVIQEKLHLLDVNWCKYDDDQQARFEEKQEKYKHLVDNDPHRVIPIIISYSGIIYEGSARMLNDLLPEIGPEMMYKCIYREIARSWSRAEILT